MPVDFNSILRRVRDILQANPELKSRINKFRYGELTTDRLQNARPPVSAISTLRH